MSDQSFGESYARALQDSRPVHGATKIMTSRRPTGCVFAGLGVPAFIVFVIFLAVLFVPPLISNPERYSGHGASVDMVQPEGNDGERDLTYAEVNQGNAKANLTNSGANVMNVFALTLLFFAFAVVGIVFVGAKLSLRE